MRTVRRPVTDAVRYCQRFSVSYTLIIIIIIIIITAGFCRM